MKKTLFAATVLAASLMAASTVQAAPQEVTMWHYFDQKPEQEMLADMVEEYNSLQDDIHINATFVSRTELMNQYTVGALSGELPDIGQVDSPDMASYVSLGVFEDITDELDAWGELDQFYDGPLSSCKDPDGKVYGLPQNSNCLALACNLIAASLRGGTQYLKAEHKRGKEPDELVTARIEVGDQMELLF